MRTIDAQQGIRILDTRSTASLLSRVLWITTAGFLFTAFGAYIAPEVLGGIGYLTLVIASFALIFAVNIASKRSPGLALVLFYVFTTVMGIEIGPLLKAYLHLDGGISIVFDAAVTTAVGMAVMALVAQIANFNYQRVGAFARAALLGLIIVGVVSMFFHFLSPGVYAWASLAIFTVLLLVDFMRLRDGAIGLTPVQMALRIYLDALNIFLALLQIFGGGRRDSR
jgi:modulator of FtsH protease